MPGGTERTALSPEFLFEQEVVLLTGTANLKLAQKIGVNLEKEVYMPVSRFADGEAGVKIPVNVRRKIVFIIQPTSPPVDSNIIELALIIDAARRSSAKEINVVIPYFGYARQDRKDEPRVPISAAVIAEMIGGYKKADRILTIDIHSEQQQGDVVIPWDNLYASYVLLPCIMETGLKNLVVASPDKGGVSRATAFATRLGGENIAIVYKERDLQLKNHSRALTMIGDVAGRDVLIVDDIIDTAGTIVNAAKLLKKRGAERIFVAAAHGLFSGPALRRIAKSPIEKVWLTDTVAPRPEVRAHPKIEIVSVAPLLSEAIWRIYSGESLSEALIR